MSLSYCSWTEGFTSSLQQWIPKKTSDLASDNFKKLSFFMIKAELVIQHNICVLIFSATFLKNFSL